MATTVQVIVPDEVMPLIAYAAKADGWQATVLDGAGNPVENPESAFERLFAITVRMATSQAINMMAQEEAEKARKKVTEEMQAKALAWMEAMKNG